MVRVCNGTFFFGPAPWGPGEEPKGQILLNIIKGRVTVWPFFWPTMDLAEI